MDILVINKVIRLLGLSGLLGILLTFITISRAIRVERIITRIIDTKVVNKVIRLGLFFFTKNRLTEK